MADNETVSGMYKGPEAGFGIGGINGMHHNVLGWDNTTVGMASSVFDNLLSQQGIKSNDPNLIGALEPIRQGKFIAKWLKVPPFFNDVAVKYLKFFLENAVKSLSGIQGSNINPSGTVTFGANGQEMDFPGQLKENNKNVTLNTITCTGDGLGKLMRYWMYGITDPVTGIHHMYGKNMRFYRPNYSGTLIYIFLGPTCRPGDIEYSCIWNEVWPTSSDSKDQFDSGDVGNDTAISEKSVELTGIFQDGPECNILAKYIVAGSGLSGQSYFDQMLPAYMYDKYINKIAASGGDSTDDTISAMSLEQKTKIDNSDSIYSDDTLATRKDLVRDKYGLDSDVVPSSVLNSTSATSGVPAVTDYGVANFTE